MLEKCDEISVSKLQSQNRDIVTERLAQENLRTVTLDFDGSVLSTNRKAEGSAVGYNKNKKGARSYYPLFCTVAQSGQILDALHRSGNVHDSNGAVEFVKTCVRTIRQALPGARIEARMDLAFFNDAMIKNLEILKVQYAISVPFERFHELKAMIETHKRWSKIPERNASNPLLKGNGNPSPGIGKLASCSILAHNLCRELQMRTWERFRQRSEKRPALWTFEKIQSLRNTFICKAGRFTRPAGKPMLTLNSNPVVEQYLRNYLPAA